MKERRPKSVTLTPLSLSVLLVLDLSRTVSFAWCSLAFHSKSYTTLEIPQRPQDFSRLVAVPLANFLPAMAASESIASAQEPC